MIEQSVTDVARHGPATPPAAAPAAEGWREARETLVSALFLLALTLPALGMLFPTLSPPLHPGREQRAKLPVWGSDRRSLTRYPVGFHRYFEDNFGFRGALIRYHSLAKIHWLGVSPSPRVIVGREGWLYYGAMHEVDCLRCARPFAEEELAQWERAVAERQAWAEQHGSHLLIVVCPDKHTIYPEYLPPNLRASDRRSRYDQLCARLSRMRPKPALVRVRPALLAAKSEHQVYYRLDTHWTHAGALIASEPIFARLRQWFPEVRPLRWRPQSRARPVMDWRHLADMLGLTRYDVMESIRRPRLLEAPGATWLAGTDTLPRLRIAGHQVTVTERTGAPIPRAVVFGDSFMGFLAPYLSQRIGRAVYSLDGEFDPELLEAERPDVVIWEVVERRLMQPVPSALGEEPSPEE